MWVLAVSFLVRWLASLLFRYKHQGCLTVVAEGVDRVFAGGFDGGVDAKDEADDNGSGERDHEDVDVDVGVERSDNRK